MRALALLLAGVVAAAPAATVNLAWDAVPDARVTGYELGWGSAPGQYQSYQLAPGTSGTLDLPEGAAAYIAVRALGEADGQPITSAWSNEVVWSLAPETTQPLGQRGLWATYEPGEDPVMADPAFGALGTISSSGSNSVNSLTSTLTGISAGDLVLAFVQRESQNACTGVSLAGSQALSLLKSSDADRANFAFDVWGAIASASHSSASITASYSTSDQWGTIISARYSNVASATPLTSSCNSTGCSGLPASSLSRAAQSITTSVRALIIAAGTDWNDYRTHTPASGWTERADGSGTPVTSLQFLHDRVSDAGTFGGATAFATTSAPDEYLSVLLAFEPSSGGASAVLPAIAFHRTQHGMQ